MRKSKQKRPEIFSIRAKKFSKFYKTEQKLVGNRTQTIQNKMKNNSKKKGIYMNNEKGFLLFYDWLPALECLSNKDFRIFLTALINYQREGTPMPDFPNKLKTIASLIVPQIERRMYMAEIGKKGAVARYGKGGEPPKKEDFANGVTDAFANGRANGVAIGGADSTPLAIDKDIDKDKDLDETESENTDADGDAVAVALAENARGISAGGRGYGRHGNVYLSTEEYLALSREIPMLPQYIDRFSEKMHQKGYRYPSHFDAIRQWWRRDKNLDAFAPEKEGSFETDSFFEAAVRRSLGDAFFERLND